MLEKIDFEKVKPYFDNGVCKWYVAEYFQNYLNNQQAFNLPPLEGIGCFVVKGVDIEDYVLIDTEQKILGSYRYNHEGFEQMDAKINMLKVSKYYDDEEGKSNI